MNSELLATCNALGYLEENDYYKESDCLDNIKCLIKYLHNEDTTRDVRTQLGSVHLVQNDLIPILSQYPDESDLFHAVLRLLINLTQPALLCFGGKAPKDVTMNHHFLEVVAHNQAYKEAFGNQDKIWDVFTQKVYDILETDWEDRKPEDGLVVERFLILLRNLLHVPPTADDKRKAEEDVSTHDKLLWQIHRAGVDSLLLYMSGSTTEQEFCLHLMEIVCLFLKEQDAEQLAKTGKVPSISERQKEGNQLLEMRKAEEAKRKQQRAKMTPWHSRFGGSYVKVGTKALSDGKDLIIHKSVKHCETLTFDEGKSKLRKARNRRALVEDKTTRRSSVNIRLMLKTFCVGLLENGYNMLMRSVKDRMSREKAQDHDESYFFWAMNFFMEFNRFHKFRIELVSETMQLATLHFLDVKMMDHFELMTTDKQEAATWGKRMHLAFRCYHQFLKTIYTMDNSKDPSLKESARVLMNNLFYMVEYREVFLTLLRKFDERKQTRAFLRDLVRGTHLFLKMFESFCKDNKVVVEKKVRGPGKRAKKKKKKWTSGGTERHVFTEEEKANKWTEIRDGLTTAFGSSDQNDDAGDQISASSVFDPTSDLSEEVQQQRALLKIQQSLLGGDASGAVLTLRTARSVWPERNIFGAAESTDEQATNTLHEICLADLTNVEAVADLEGEDQDGEGEDELEEEEEVQSLPQRTKEIEFNLEEFTKKFADSRLVMAYSHLLQEFETNDADTNHCVAKMLHRIGFDLKMYGLLFQASIFRVFQKAFASSNKAHKELAAFGRWVIAKFCEVSRTNSCVFAEMLFWKQSVAEVYELTEGYGSFVDPKKPTKITWSEEENQELFDLFYKFKDQEIDTVDGILSCITDQTRTRRQICNQLVNRALVDSVADLKRTKGGKSAVWREDDIVELERLYEEFSNSEDPLGKIIQMMSNKKSKPKVIEKLLALGIVTDRKALYKRRSKKPRSSKPEPELMHVGADEDSDSEAANRDDSDDDAYLSSGDDAPFNSSRIQSAASQCFVANLHDAVSWLKGNLLSFKEDFTAASSTDDLEPVPLVPLTEEQEEAMSNKIFKKLLKSIGILPPANEQERFWRIPSTLKPSNIETAIGALSQVHKKRKRVAETLESSDDESGKDDEPTEKRRKSSHQSNTDVAPRIEATSIDDNESSDEDPSDNELPAASRRKHAIILPDDDDNDSADDVRSEVEDKTTHNIDGSNEDPSDNELPAALRRKHAVILPDDDDNDSADDDKSDVRDDIAMDTGAAAEDETSHNIDGGGASSSDEDNPVQKRRKRTAVLSDDDGESDAELAA